MKTLLVSVVVLIGLVALGQSLSCNNCPVGLIGVCLIPSTVVCSGNTSSCYTGKATFPGISSFVGFNYQGCVPSTQCNSTTTGTILGAAYTITQSCCSTNLCNPTQLTSSAPYMQLSLTAALSTSLVAYSWGY